jgi:hypothetical protein
MYLLRCTRQERNHCARCVFTDGELWVLQQNKTNGKQWSRDERWKSSQRFSAKLVSSSQIRTTKLCVNVEHPYRELARAIVIGRMKSLDEHG